MPESEYNLVGVSTALPGVGNQTVENALLGPLVEGDWPTPTHTLQPGSPAIDAASPGSNVVIDQRYLPRPIDDPSVVSNAPADIGAFEYDPPNLDNPIVVDTLSGAADGLYGERQVSLADAIALTNASPDHDTIVFADTLFGVGNDESISEDEIVNTALRVPVSVVTSPSLSEPTGGC